MTDRLKAIKERVDAASVGPWRALQGMNNMNGGGWRESLCLTNDTHFICWFDPHMDANDRVFVVHAREDVEWLHEELRLTYEQLRRVVTSDDGQTLRDAWEFLYVRNEVVKS